MGNSRRGSRGAPWFGRGEVDLRVLVLHSRYLSGAASGENRVVEDEVRLLREAGHEVHTWIQAPAVESGGATLRAGINAVWSRRAVTRVRELTRRHRVELVHFHNLFPTLSPAALSSAAESACVILTLHNYRLFCLPATLLREGRICQDCLHRPPWRGIVHGCYRGSRAASGALAASLTLHRALGSFSSVSRYLAVSQFARDKHVEAGFPPERVRVKGNFAWPARPRHGPGEYFLYLGRLSREKGIHNLLSAWRPSLGRLVVAGDGPEARRIEGHAAVTFVGPVPATQVAKVVSRARAVLLPSVCYEAGPRVVLEANACGVPVIASQIGGLPELIEDRVSGLLVTPGDVTAWTEALDRLLDNGESERLGDGAYALWRERFTPERGLAELEAAYREALGDGTPTRDLTPISGANVGDGGRGARVNGRTGFPEVGD